MKIAIIGTGTMGSGIVQTFIQAGYDVLMKGRSEASLGKAQKTIEKNLGRLVEKGKLSETERDEMLGRITQTMSYEDCKDCGLVIEAIAEDMEIKKDVLGTLDKICSPETILATNSSSLSITEIAASTSRPEKVIGMHFFNPVPLMKLVEVIRGQLTADSVFDCVSGIAKQVGKVPVEITEAPGFLVNRLLIPMINEGISALADGVAKKEEIDEAMKLGAGHPLGPLALADLIGLDVCLAIMEVLHHEFGDDKYRPHPLLRKMVRANLLGRKTGIGFYDYRK